MHAEMRNSFKIMIMNLAYMGEAKLKKCFVIIKVQELTNSSGPGQCSSELGGGNISG